MKNEGTEKISLPICKCGFLADHEGDHYYCHHCEKELSANDVIMEEISESDLL